MYLSISDMHVMHENYVNMGGGGGGGGGGGRRQEGCRREEKRREEKGSVWGGEVELCVEGGEGLN